MGRTTEYEHFGKKVKRQGGDVYAGGGLFGPRKVGTWEDTEPLPESMQTESERVDKNISHREILSNYENELGLPRKYIQQELYSDLFDKGLCGFCESPMSQKACTSFNRQVSSIAEQYMEFCCASCGAWIDETREVREVQPMSVRDDDGNIPPEMPSHEMKNQHLPCECTFDFGEDLWFPQAQVPENDKHRLARLAEVTDTITCDRCDHENDLRGSKHRVERCDYCGQPFAEVVKIECNNSRCHDFRMALSKVEGEMDFMQDLMEKHAKHGCDDFQDFREEEMKIEEI